MTSKTITYGIAIACGMFVASCGRNSCDDKSIVDMTENEMRKHFNTDSDPRFVWDIPKSGLASIAIDDIIILEGDATYNGINGARKTGRAIARVYCNGKDPMQISLVTVYGAFEKVYMNTKDTSLSREEQEHRDRVLKYRMDSLHRAHERDSLLRTADSLMRAAGF